MRKVTRILMPAVLLLGLLAASSASAQNAARPLSRDGAMPRFGADKVVIAHRGASGYLPAHTIPAYAMAYTMGADYIETDLVMTRDGALVALHDIHLDSTTDVEQQFPSRARDDGQWYAADFTLAELKTLN